MLKLAEKEQEDLNEMQKVKLEENDAKQSNQQP